MRKVWKLRLACACGLAFVGAMLFVGLNRADARPQYYREFTKKYEDVAEKNDVKKKVKCAVCHIQGKPKKMRNVYGKALAEVVGKKNQKDKKLIDEAFAKAEKKKSAIDGKTFGDLLKDGKLPASEE